MASASCQYLVLVTCVVTDVDFVSCRVIYSSTLAYLVDANPGRSSSAVGGGESRAYEKLTLMTFA